MVHDRGELRGEALTDQHHAWKTRTQNNEGEEEKEEERDIGGLSLHVVF